MFHRMREHIRIQSAGVEPFQHSTDRVKSDLVKLLDKLDHDLISITTRLMDQTTRDYTTCIVTPLVHQFASSSQRQLRVKQEVAGVIRGAELELELEALLEDIARHGCNEDGDDADGQRERHALETIKEEEEYV